jgi:hypothetical protein
MRHQMEIFSTENELFDSASQTDDLRTTRLVGTFVLLTFFGEREITAFFEVAFFVDGFVFLLVGNFSFIHNHSF